MSCHLGCLADAPRTKNRLGALSLFDRKTAATSQLRETRSNWKAFTLIEAEKLETMYEAIH
jgi:hypothetical protein